MCVRVKKTREIFSLAMRHTQKIIVIDLWFFPSKRKGFSRNFFVLVCDCYFELLILSIILFGILQQKTKRNTNNINLNA